MKPLFFADDPQFWFETLRALGHAAYGGAEAGEVLATAERITAGDYDSWYDEWSATAAHTAETAATALAAGHPVTARDAYLRANNYFRVAEFFLHGDPGDPRIATAYEQAVGAFQTAAELFEPRVQQVAIPFEGHLLHGYYYRAPGDAPAPAVIMHNGFDGSAEEMHFFGAAAALERGYHVLTFDGPGQPWARFRDGLPFRPDWEKVVTPVFDWLIAGHPEVDPGRVALLGLSMGGLLAPRAAAFEHRLAAVIAVDGVYDLGEVSRALLPSLTPDQAEARLRAEEAPEVDAAIEALMKVNPTVRWAVTHGSYVMGVQTPRQFVAAYLDYSLAGGIAERITAPTLVCDAEEDLFFAGQALRLYEHLTCPRTLLRFTVAEGSGAHCHAGAQRLAFGRVFDWLDAVVRP
ncbi:alpha/beta fold hydrolase [Kitasatospora sp. NPDC058170]|uniref:alpha/beta hydrolase family protein n=1 Tax=Kitasatospora sp. NPDC058170 TaxID=3346364 RepID=UPI0036D8A879